ncbi:MAG TPA: peptide-N-glycosidase F-related protein, partial [Bacteroidia bacterium]|nr:peptide-N-glycosidase F-related protein [Bacteroidia bacterium]
MKKPASLLLLLLLVLPLRMIAANGDTTVVQSHNAAIWSWYGSIDSWAVFPDTSVDYRKITLKYKLGCPTSGCSAWDYTTQIFIMRHTGMLDSNMVLSPYFTVNGNADDSVLFNNDSTYVYFFNTTTLTTDSTLAATLQLVLYQDSLNPQTPTDTLWVYPGNYYNYLYDTTGAVIDSSFVGADSTWYNGDYTFYNVFEIIEPIQIARYITPYGNNLSPSWNNTWLFDITDYAPLLHDSVEIRAFYSGWSSGFAITLDFELIEGTPPRTPIRITPLWSGYFPYGNTSNSIENYLVPRTQYIAANEVNSEVRIDITGHGFGGNENCAEFCAKMYYLKLDNVTHFGEQVWRDKCGLNAHYPQGGTWLYDRANWCPGDRVYPFSHEITSLVTPGDSVVIDMDMDYFVNINNSNPGYQVDGQLITYGAPNFSLDVEMQEIIAPNNFTNVKRLNPICKSPVVIIRNVGSTTLTSVVINYGVTGATQSTYTWNGNLLFLESDTVYLPATDWFGTAAVFSATVSSPNGNADQYSDNNSLSVPYVAAPSYTAYQVYECRTNLDGWHTSYTVEDASGNILISRNGLSANTIYRDTFLFSAGCYIFRHYDAGKDGLSFWANNSGAGYMRIKNATTGAFIKNFGADFGTALYQEFTVGYNIGQAEQEAEQFMEVYPNPTGGLITVDFQ